MHVRVVSGTDGRRYIRFANEKDRRGERVSTRDNMEKMCHDPQPPTPTEALLEEPVGPIRPGEEPRVCQERWMRPACLRGARGAG